MVFFTCNACGDSVKKGQVEKHVAVCGSCECLLIDCLLCYQELKGDDYKNHVKCISEDQKYGGKGYEGKTHKGDIKQQAWIQKINELIKKPNVSPKVRELLEQISGFDNIPRKRAKFQNWMKNSLKIYNESILEQVWSIFSEASRNEPASEGQDKQPLNQVANPCAEISAKAPSASAHEAPEQQAEEELKLENQQENSRSQKPKKRKKGQEAELEAGSAATPEANGTAGKRGKKKSGKGQCPAERGVNENQGQEEGSAKEKETKAGTGKRKRKHSEGEADSKKKKIKLPGRSEGGEMEDHDPPVKGKFNWKGTIKAVLKQAPDNEITVKKLKKKVLAQYYAAANERHKSEEELLVIFNKKISKNPTFKLLKDKVKLLK
uniref:Ly1 antibody reactive n=1 Tax=Loxodonta africana TaxID=9785 RepID=G3THA1_LOXAF